MNRQLDDTSTALLTAAHELLAEHGADALTVRRIATEAGMSTMNVYSRFGGKDGVIDELYADGFRRLIAAVQAVPVADDIADELLDVALAYRQFALDNPTYYGIMMQATVAGFTPSPESIELALGGLASFAERVARGQQRGDLVTFEGHDATECAAWLLATCHGMISLELDSIAAERVSWPSIFELGMRTAIAGLRPATAAAGAT